MRTSSSTTSQEERFGNPEATFAFVEEAVAGEHTATVRFGVVEKGVVRFALHQQGAVAPHCFIGAGRLGELLRSERSATR